MVVLTVKLVALTLSVTWGLTKTILFGVGLPVSLASAAAFRHLRKGLPSSAWDVAARLY